MKRHESLNAKIGVAPCRSRRAKNFATQVNADILSAVRGLAQTEGRRIQALIDEALADLLEKRKQARPPANAMATYQASHDRYAPLYRKLAE